jgi:aminoglycoside phosphotransferase (APT) family kinase protein
MARAGGTSQVDSLRTLLADHFPGAEVEDLQRLSGGASRETWRFRANGRSWVLQQQRNGDVRDMEIEASAVAAAGAAGVAVPRLHAFGRSADGAAHMILDAVDGETIARKIQRDDEFAFARTVLTEQLGATLASIHAVEPGGISGLESPDQIERYTEVLDDLGESRPVLELARRWLLDRRPDSTEHTLVHGDFRLGNLIIGADGLRAVIDWELVHLGDPMEDLGWLCVRAWRFGQRPPVAGLGAYADLFAAYEAAGGATVDPAVVRWWEVLGTWKWAIMCIVQADVHLSGAARSHELAAVGRRVCENEHDLLSLMAAER